MELLHESNRMRHHAEHDGLTGLWNHRVIVERLGEEMNRSLRDGTPLSVILVDVDHFKKINDSFGHLAGDLVLKEIGTIFMRSLRPYDCVGRYGGEEFLLILPNCEIESALIRGEQLRVAVQSARIMDGETMLQVTASFGVASALPFHYEAETVIRAVDAALYRAKSSGRNCVIQAEMNIQLCES
jgi:diguanylate cyclase (GGDEF)-like protein